MFDHIKWSKIHVILVLEGVERGNAVEYIVGKNLAIISPNLKGFSFKNKCKTKCYLFIIFQRLPIPIISISFFSFGTGSME